MQCLPSFFKYLKTLISKLSRKASKGVFGYYVTQTNGFWNPWMTKNRLTHGEMTKRRMTKGRMTIGTMTKDRMTKGRQKVKKIEVE